MYKIWVMALNTYKESIRDKILYNLGAMALVLVIFSLVLGDWSVFDREHVIKSFSLAVLSYSGVMLAIFVGIGLVQKEIQKKTILTILAKPIKRSHFILGKFFGLSLLLTTHFLITSAMLFFILWVGQTNPNFALVQAILLLWIQLLIIVSVSILFSTFTTPTLAALFTFGVFLAGNLSGEILKQVEGMLNRGEISLNEFSGQIYVWVAKGIYYVFPNLEQYNITGVILHEGPIDGLVFLKLVGFALAYIIAFLAISSWWFDRKDFI